jgi:hypothetical protein
MMAPQIQRLKKFKKFPLHLHYRLYPARQCDGANIIAVVTKYFCDALICYTNIPDDNLKFISSESWEFRNFDTKKPRVEIIIT